MSAPQPPEFPSSDSNAKIKAFNDQAASIIVQYQGINPQSRLVLTELAKNLRLSPIEMEGTLTELDNAMSRRQEPLNSKPTTPPHLPAAALRQTAYPPNQTTDQRPPPLPPSPQVVTGATDSKAVSKVNQFLETANALIAHHGGIDSKVHALLMATAEDLGLNESEFTRS